MHLKNTLLVCCCVMFALPNVAIAQTGFTAELIRPQVGQRGTTVELILEGHYLENPEEILFYQPGIRCTELKPLKSGMSYHHPAKAVGEGRLVKLTFEISASAKVGEYQFRVRTRDKLSEMLTFWVTPFLVIHERNPYSDLALKRRDRVFPHPEKQNDSPEYAQPIEINTTVAGYVLGYMTQDHDWYSLDCKKGQRVSLEVVASRLGTLHNGGLNDTTISLHNEKGELIAENGDNALHNQDPVLSAIIPADGKYFVHMRQQMDFENQLRHYLIHVGEFPRPMLAFPLGGSTGSQTSFRLIGDVRGEKQIKLVLPKTVGDFEQSFLEIFENAEGEQQPTWPNRITVADMPNVMEVAAETSEENPQVIATKLPVSLNGIIAKEGQVDWYQFSAKKGDRYRIRTYAKTLDSELDPRVWIRPAPGNNSRRSYDQDDSLWPEHDLVGHHYRHQVKQLLDSVFMFESDLDGDWLIGIGDTRRESGPQHAYRVEFQPHVESAFVHYPQYPSQSTIVRDRITLYPGRTFSRPVRIQPGLGAKYNKPLELVANGLPAGVTMSAPTFRLKDGLIPVFFHCDENVKRQALTFEMDVRPVAPGDREQFRGGFVQVVPATNRRGDYAMYFNRTRKAAVGICSGANFDIKVEQPKIPLVRNGELTLNVTVERYNGFEDAIYCEADWLPVGVNKQPPLLIPAGETSGTYKLSAANNAVAGTFPISITARENSGGNVRFGSGFHFIGSKPVNLAIGEPYVTVKLLRAAIERGSTGEIDCEIEHHRPFSGTAELRLGRLPFGVKQADPIPQIKAGQETAKFKLKVTNDCLLGQYKEIYCEVIVKDGGQEILQQTGSGLLRVDPPRDQSSSGGTR